MNKFYISFRMLYKCLVPLFLFLISFTSKAERSVKSILFDIRNTIEMEDIQQSNDPIKVNGRVLDSNGGALPGATVLEAGTSNGTITDLEGNFSLTIGEDETLVVTFIGFVTQEIPVGGRTRIDVVLEEDIQTLSEVVVIGYGTQIKQKVVGSITTIDAEEQLDKRPITTFVSGLEGAAPGLRINFGNGSPGSNPDINIRGNSSLSGQNVLVIVDGIESNITDVDPNIVENVSILKDASAAAIYGNRAANGVILIETKKGEVGKPAQISYKFNTGFQTPTATPEVVGTLDYMLMKNKGNVNNGIEPVFTEEQITAARNGELPNTDWADLIYGELAPQFSHSMTISKATESNDYVIGLSYLTQDGISTATDAFQRYNLRLKANTDVNNWLKIGNNTAVTYRDRYTTPTGDDNNRNYRAVPLYPERTDDGAFINGDGGSSGNFLLTTQSGSYNDNKRIVLESQMTAQIQILKNLKMDQKYSVRVTDESNESWRTDIDHVTMIFDENGFSEPIPVLASSSSRNMTIESVRNARLIYQGYLTYDNSFNKHSITALAGIQTDDVKSETVTSYAEDFLFADTQDIDKGLNEDEESVAQSESNEALFSYYGRLTYDYEAKYMFEMSFRYDASSKFPDYNRWGAFPSVSLGWNIGDEAFVQNNLPFVDFMKLRGSWGQLGDQNGAGRYEYSQTYNYGGNYIWSGELQRGIVPGQAASPYITWENSDVINGGVDISVLNGRLEFTGEYYINNRENILDPGVIVAPEFGLDPPVLNGASVKSWGWEFDVTHRNKIGPIDVQVNLNYANYKNEITKLGPSGASIGNTVQDEGLPINALRGYVSDGFIRDIFDLNDYLEANDVVGNIETPYIGGIRLVDVTGDGVINDDDKVIIDDNQKNHLIGGSISLGYKTVRLTMRIAGNLEDKVYWGGEQTDRHFSGGIGAPFEVHKSSFDPEDVRGTYNADFPMIQPGNFAYDRSDFWLRNNAYIRMRNISLSYNASKLVSKAIPAISRCNVYASAENPFMIWTNYFAWKGGWDPELGQGAVDYPLARTFSMGINVNF